jgi:peptidoglycan/LPS O-acetylase OafA/YrhL
LVALEVIFSLALPLFLVVPIYTRSRPRLACLAGVASLALIALGAERYSTTFACLPLFELGALLAFHAHRLPRASGLMLPLAACLLTAGYWMEGVPATQALPMPTVMASIGACLIVWISLSCRVLTRRPARWLGSRSYSLYLIHAPIVAALAFTGHRALILLAIPLSLVFAEVFWRSVERPSTRFARVVGRAVASQVDYEAPGAASPEIPPAAVPEADQRATTRIRRVIGV